MATPKAFKIFCYGDSLTAGTSPPLKEDFPYGKHLQETLRSVPGFESSLVRWKGYPGWTSSALFSDSGLAGLLNNIHASVGTLDLVIILAGTNDLAYNFDCEEIFESISSIHNIAHSKGCKTVALGIPPSGWQAQSESAKTVANNVNSKLKDAAAKIDSKMTFVPFPIDFDRNSGYWSSDTLHFSPEGYRQIGESLSPIISDILKSLK